MSKQRSYQYCETWWLQIRGLPDATVAELTRAINAYMFDGVVPELTPGAQDTFARIKRDIDAETERRDAIRAKRSSAGRMGNARRWGGIANATEIVANATKSVANAIICDKNIANATEIVANAIETDEKSQKIANAIESPHTPLYIDNNNYSPPPPPPGAHTCEGMNFDIVFGWLTDNQQTTEAQLKKLKLISEPMTADEMKAMIEPFAREYYDGEIIRGTDFARKQRSDTRRHFGSWLMKQNIILQNGKPRIERNQQMPGATGDRGVARGVGGNPTKSDYYDAF